MLRPSTHLRDFNMSFFITRTQLMVVRLSALTWDWTWRYLITRSVDPKRLCKSLIWFRVAHKSFESSWCGFTVSVRGGGKFCPYLHIDIDRWPDLGMAFGLTSRLPSIEGSVRLDIPDVISRLVPGPDDHFTAFVALAFFTSVKITRKSYILAPPAKQLSNTQCVP